MFEKLIKNFQPQIADIEHGKEPTIHQMMLHYYLAHGINHEKAADYVRKYIDAIESIKFQ